MPDRSRPEPSCAWGSTSTASWPTSTPDGSPGTTHQFGTELLPEHVDIWDAPTLLTHFTDMGEFWSWARTSGDGASIFRILEPYHGASKHSSGWPHATES